MTNTMITDRSELSPVRAAQHSPTDQTNQTNHTNDNNNNNSHRHPKCRQSTAKKRSPHSDSTSSASSCSPNSSSSSSMSSPERPTLRRRVIQRRGRYYESCQMSSSIVKSKLLKVKSTAKSLHHWTRSVITVLAQNGLTCLKSSHWTQHLLSRPMCYLIQLIERYCRPWIRSFSRRQTPWPVTGAAGAEVDACADDKEVSERRLSSVSRLPDEAIAPTSSSTQASCKTINNNNNNESSKINNNSNSNNNNINSSNKWSSSSMSMSYYMSSLANMYSPLLSLILIISFICRITDACSSRSTPKPRPPSPTTRPNITFQTYACPEAYAKWYCLNGATCFSVRIGESILYNCECADGYMGQRCEFKDLDGSYLPSREKVLVETASIAGGVTVAVLLMVFIIVLYYTYLRHRKKKESSLGWELDSATITRTVRPFSRADSLRRVVPRNMSFALNDDYFGLQEDDKRLQNDLECGDDLVPHVFRPVVVTSDQNCDRNHDK